MKPNSPNIIRLSMDSGEITELVPKEVNDVEFYSSHVFTVRYRDQFKLFACAVMESDHKGYERGKLDSFLELIVVGE